MPTKPEDANLQTDQFADLNRDFYDPASSPHRFLRQRVRALLVAGSRDEHILEAQGGLRFGNFVAGFPPDHPELDPKTVENFVVTESVVLFHHAAEALMRLVLAHLDSPPCPWLEMRRLTFQGYTQGLDRLRTDLGTPEGRQELMRIFYASDSAEETRATLGEEVWRSVQQALVDFLSICLGHLREGGEMYNAAKHGLSAAGKDDRFLLLEGEEELGAGTAPDEERTLLSAQGHCLTYLHRTKNPPRWMKATTWVNAEQNILLTSMAANYMENLWKVAQINYLPETDEGQRRFQVITQDQLWGAMRAVTRSSPANNLTAAIFLRYEGDGGVSGRVTYSLVADEEEPRGDLDV